MCPVRCITKWQGMQDSNLRHLVLETSALPTELIPYVGLGLFLFVKRKSPNEKEKRLARKSGACPDFRAVFNQFKEHLPLRSRAPATLKDCLISRDNYNTFFVKNLRFFLKAVVL